MTIAEATDGDPLVHGISQVDHSGDGLPDVTILDCQFATTHDRVYVYDGAGDMLQGEAWSEVTDFVNDTWVFDVGMDGTAQLIVRFLQRDGRSVALLYDDQNQDGKVAHEAEQGNITMTEGASWSLRVESDGAWLLPDGFPNQNLRFFSDGSMEQFSEVVDSNHDGIAEHEVWNLLVSDAGQGKVRSNPGIWVNDGNSRPSILPDSLFWPFLVSEAGPGARNKFDSIPYIVVDWHGSRLTGTSVGKNAGGYPIESGYFLLSMSPWYEGRANYANFENPMAYYDLAKDHDGVPELHVRLEYFGPFDPDLDIGQSPIPVNGIRYSWNQWNAAGLHWDYRVGLAGSALVTSVVDLDGFQVHTVPYSELPAWVGDRTWAWGTFVARESGSYPSSEGIYEWSEINVVQADSRDRASAIPGSQQELRAYLTGSTAKPIEHFYQEIRPGLRGEFGYLGDRPFLYLSPIDAKLHLRGALQGVWSLGDGSEIRYVNIDADDYLDVWRHLKNGELLQELIHTKEYLFLAREQELVVKHVQVPYSVLEVLPPADHDEWIHLQQQLDVKSHEMLPDGFEAMLSQFDGPSTHIRGATLDDFRVVRDGLRFVLELQPGYGTEGADLLGIQGHEPDRYLMLYDGVFTSEPLTPSKLRLTPFRQASQGLVAHTVGELAAIVENIGLADAPVVLVEIEASQSEMSPTIEMSQTLSVLSAESVPVRFEWAPDAAGPWMVQIRARALNEDGSVVDNALTGWEMDVAPAEEPSVEEALGAFGLVQPAVPLLLLAAAAAAGSLTIFATLRAARDGPGQPPSSRQDWEPQ